MEYRGQIFSLRYSNISSNNQHTKEEIGLVLREIDALLGDHVVWLPPSQSVMIQEGPAQLADSRDVR